MKQGTLKVTTPTDRDIVMTREFNAPRHLVFEAYTRPEFLTRWLGVHNGWVLAECEVDLRVGGAYRYLWRSPKGETMGMRGVFLEVVRPSRLVATEIFDQSWYEGEAVDTLDLVEKGGRTTLSLTVTYQSKAVRDAVLKSPMEQGVAGGFDKMEELLAGMAQGAR